MIKVCQLITSATKEIVPLLLSATFPARNVNGRPAHDISLEYTPNNEG